MRLVAVTGVGSALLTDAKVNLSDLFDDGSGVVSHEIADELVAPVEERLP